MATAAKSVSAGPSGVEAGQIPLPGAAEMFAAMVSVANEGEAAAGGTPVEVAPEEIGENPEAEIDASVLLPMLDQQRAANPAAKLVSPAVDTPPPVTCMIAPAIVTTPAEAGVPAAPADPIPVAERIVGKGANACMVAPVDDPVTETTQVMRPLPDGKTAAAPVTYATPVMRPLPDGKPAPLTVTGKSPVMRPALGSKPNQADVADPAPVMRPLPEGKAAPVAIADPAPVMRPIPGSKPNPVAVADPAPVMRPLDSAAPKTEGAPPAMQGVKSEGPFANEAPPSLQVKVTQPATTTAQIPADLALKATPPLPGAAAQPQAKAAEIKTATPEVQVAAAEAQAAPVAAKARVGSASAAPVTVETTSETAGTTPIAATATDTRAAVQPLHATPALVQPLAAPVGAPVQNVAAALSQQVLDMSGGDAWIDQIARDISQTAGKDGTMRFRLAPETLGELKVEITHSERGAHVRLNVTSESAQQALAAAEHKLTAEARAQGVRIAETEINFTGGQSQSRDASAFAREQSQQQAQANHQPRTPRGTSAPPFTSSAAAPEGRGRTDRYA